MEKAEQALSRKSFLLDIMGLVAGEIWQYSHYTDSLSDIGKN